MKKIELKQNIRQLAILIDPDKQDPEDAALLACRSEQFGADIILVGGSLLTEEIEQTVQAIKQSCSLPVLLFPGHASHVCSSVDGVLLLSLLSGRNADFLIGNHVVAAPQIKRLGLQTISCGYILIESGKTTSVEYISNTKPIPADKTDIVVATALAGEMIGNACIYLEGGSGAENKVGTALIHKVKENLSIPLIVGGGIQTAKDAEDAYNAGADIVVVGTALENDPGALESFCLIKQCITN